MSFTSANLRSLAYELGFDHVSLTRPTLTEKDKTAYQAWLANGHSAGMGYMSAHPTKRLDIQTTFPNIKTILTIGVSYFQGPFPVKPGPGYGRVARYAWGVDYHVVVTARLEEFLRRLNLKGTIAVDTKPLLERALARQAGLGFVGKNTVLIIPKKNNTLFHMGSFLFLAELLLEEELPPDPVAVEPSDGCGSCTKCLTACPTRAFEGPYQLNAGKCISYLTIENKGHIPEEMRRAVGDWLFGCDICQDACPFNARAYETRWPEFQAERGVGAWVSLEEILSIPDQAAFKAKWGHTPLSRAKRKGMIRNACVAAGNSGDKTLQKTLEPLCRDPDELIREHAIWAMEELSST